MTDRAISLCSAEMSAMAGIPWMQRCLYLILRWYMDGRTGRVGEVRGISYQSLAEELYVEPVRGRRASDAGSPSRDAIRNALRQMEACGLIEPCGNGEVLVFLLPKAKRVSARPKQQHHVSTMGQHHDQHHVESIAAQGNAPYQHHDQHHGVNADQHHTSRVKVNHPYTQAIAAASTHELSTGPVLLPMPPEQMADLVRRWEAKRGKVARVVSTDPNLHAWAQQGVTETVLREAYQMAVLRRGAAKNHAPINAGYLNLFVAEILDKKSKAVSKKAVAAGSGAWFATPSGIQAMAETLGVCRSEGESIGSLKDRVAWELAQRDEAKKAEEKARRDAWRARK